MIEAFGRLVHLEELDVEVALEVGARKPVTEKRSLEARVRS